MVIFGNSNKKEKKMYKIFTRNWWKENPSWPNGLEPDSGARKTTITYVNTEEEAREFCMEKNQHRPKRWIRLSRKYEYTSKY